MDKKLRLDLEFDATAVAMSYVGVGVSTTDILLMRFIVVVVDLHRVRFGLV